MTINKEELCDELQQELEDWLAVIMPIRDAIREVYGLTEIEADQHWQRFTMELCVKN